MLKNIISFIKYFLITLPIIGIILYASIRLQYFTSLIYCYSNFEIALAYILIACEFFMLSQGIGYSIHLYRTQKKITKLKIKATPIPAPSIAVMVAARHEPKNVLENTFRAIKGLKYTNKQIYLLDDSSEEKYKSEAEEIAKKYEINLFRRSVRHGAKAGIINDCIKTLDVKYIVVLDADQTPTPSFLAELVSIMEERKDLAFIQTPQYYSNVRDNAVTEGASFQQAVFYEYVCESKSKTESVFCCGTNFIMRMDALKEVGGFEENSVTEDVATSLKMHRKGWKSIYYNHVKVFGKGPDNLTEFFKQQTRWAKGNFGLLRSLIYYFIKNPFKLSFNQWFEYFLSATYYFTGITFLILMTSPILYIFFGIPSYFINPEIYISIFVPYFTISLSIFYLSLYGRNYKFNDLIKGQMLVLISFPVLIKAMFLGLLGIKGSFAITNKEPGKRLPFYKLSPQILFIILNLVATILGAIRYYKTYDIAILINSFWTFYHFIILLSVFHFNTNSKDYKPS
jgi:cellulose synthase (UDP-forming)